MLQAMKKRKFIFATLVMIFSGIALNLKADNKNSGVFKIFGKTTTIGDVEKQDQSTFYELEKKKYSKIVELAKTAFLNAYWEKKGKEQSTTADDAKNKFLNANIKISQSEIKETLKKFGSHPQLSKLSPEEQEKQIREFLLERETRQLIDSILSDATKKGQLAILYPEPMEPVFHLTVTKDDHVRYGPNDTDTSPIKCKNENCDVTIVEYSEYQCPFCARVLPDVKKILAEYKGNIRWIVRDFPLSFHDRAKPAAIAAKCASYQNKYWQMYTKLFANQRQLSDTDLIKYGSDIGLNKDKYKKCLDNPSKAEKQIANNFETGASYGVTGTPAFFINGRKLSGALPYSEFKRIIDQEIAKKDKKKS